MTRARQRAAGAGTLPGELQMGGGLEEQRFVVLGILPRGAEQALGFGDVVGRRVGAHGHTVLRDGGEVRGRGGERR